MISKLGYGYKLVLGNPVSSFPASFMWIICGKCFAENKIRLDRMKSVLLLVVSLAGLYGEWLLVKHFSGAYTNDSYFMLLPVCISAFCLFLKIKPFYIKKSSPLRECSTVMYAAHASIALVLAVVFERFLGESYPPVVYVLTVGICIIGYLIIKKLEE